MTIQLFSAVISAMCLCKALLEAFSIVKTEFFVKLFFFDFKGDISSIDLKRFRFLDIINCLISGIACGFFALTSQAIWVIIAAPIVLTLIILMYKHN